MHQKTECELQVDELSGRSWRGRWCRLIDQSIIRFAAARMPEPRGIDPHLSEADDLLRDPDFFPETQASADLEFAGERAFHFPSPVRTPYEENNLVPGCFYRCAENWAEKPTVILLHGWNDALTYHFRFPLLARRLVRGGINAVTLALPYHFERRPRQPGAMHNFISEDILRTVEAAHQGVADIRALAGWLVRAGCQQVGVWGISMGAWLGGLAACHEKRLQFAVLMTPVARMNRLIRELAFVAPIRRALGDHPVEMSRLDLVAYRPKMPRERVLLIKAEYDMFVPPETVEELWECWQRPPMWRLPHGHISVLSSGSVMKKTLEWVEGQKQYGPK